MNTGGRLILFVMVFLVSTSLQAVAGDIQYKVYGLNFSPYKDGQNPNWQTPITQAQLLERMSIIQPYTRWIRTFGTSDGLEFSGAVAHGLGLKAALGAYISSKLDTNETQIANLIAAAQRGEADLLIVGSEVLRRSDQGEDSFPDAEAKLIEYIGRVKQAVPGIQVSYADTYGELTAHPNLVAICDVLFANYYPYWEGIAIDSALASLETRYQQVKAVAGGKRVIVSETGWPSEGNTVGDAVPSPQNANRYFIDFALWAQRNKVDYFYFSAFDETWKATAKNPQEAHWGVWDKDGKLKPGRDAVFSGRECLFDWAEQNYPQLFAPASQATAAWSVYTYRYYPGTNVYLGVSATDGNVYYQGPDGYLMNEGPLSYWLPQAGCQSL